MKITKTKEYDLENMSLEDLRDFLEKRYNLNTDWRKGYYILDENSDKIITSDFDTTRNWYINKIMELENEWKV